MYTQVYEFIIPRILGSHSIKVSKLYVQKCILSPHLFVLHLEKLFLFLMLQPIVVERKRNSAFYLLCTLRTVVIHIITRFHHFHIFFSCQEQLFVAHSKVRNLATWLLHLFLTLYLEVFHQYHESNND